MRFFQLRHRPMPVTGCLYEPLFIISSKVDKLVTHPTSLTPQDFSYLRFPCLAWRIRRKSHYRPAFGLHRFVQLSISPLALWGPMEWVAIYLNSDIPIR